MKKLVTVILVLTLAVSCFVGCGGNGNEFNPESSIGNLNPSIVIERRRGLEWIVTDVEDWYDIDMQA